MKRKKYIICITLIVLAFNVTLKAQTDGWIELINGKDFTGWKASENKGTWTIVDGMFQATGSRSHLWYEGEHLDNGFRNFEIEVQVRTFKLANSGIIFHTQYQESGWPNDGFEIQINNSQVGDASYLELKRTGGIYGIRNLYKTFTKDNEWVTIRARVESNRIQVWCDSTKTVDYIQPESTNMYVKRLTEGTFCLQGHDELSKVQFRSFKVRRLPDDVKTNLAAPKHAAWYDKLVALQDEYFAFIDLNPKVILSATDLADYFYATGINTSLVRSPETAHEFSSGKNLPLFFGLKITSKHLTNDTNADADYVIGESTDLASAKALLMSGRINIWSDKTKILNAKNADELLSLAYQHSVAIEIDNVNQTPSVNILLIAKAKGLKFTFSGLVPVSAMERSQYAFAAIRAANLTYRDFYIPKF